MADNKKTGPTIPPKPKSGHSKPGSTIPPRQNPPKPPTTKKKG